MESGNLNPTEEAINNGSRIEQTEFEKNKQKYQELIVSLPTTKGWRSDEILLQFGGHWLSPLLVDCLLYARARFQPRPSTFFICSHMKTGTTWLKALSYTIVNRSRFCDTTNPLLQSSPHVLVPYVEIDFPLNQDLAALKDKKNTLFATHIPYSLLPESIVNSGCKMVYIWRDPKDTFISLWNFLGNKKGAPEMTSLVEAFDMFCRGLSVYGPYLDHVLEYWKAHQENPERILFLKYEDMRANPLPYVKRLAEFMGYGFTEEEEEKGVVEKVVNLCSFETLKNLDVNKGDKPRENQPSPYPNNIFFRKAKVGDWKNYLSPEMAARMDGLMEDKFKGTGLLQHEK